MKHLIKITLFFIFLIHAGHLFGQDFLGKDYDYVIKTLLSDGNKYETEKLDNNRTLITEYSKYDKETTQSYWFEKKGKQLICQQIDISSPEDYYGKLFWDGKELLLKEGYEKTDYIYSFMGIEDLPVYKSLDKRFKSEHYMTKYFIDGDLILLTYYLSTAEFKTK